MNRTEKINLIKQIQAGRFDDLEAIKKEREDKNRWSELFFPCFFFLVDHGRVINEGLHKEYPPISLNDFDRLFTGINHLVGGGDYAGLSDRALWIMVEIGKSFDLLRERNDLNLLEKYQQQSEKTLKAIRGTRIIDHRKK